MNFYVYIAIVIYSWLFIGLNKKVNKKWYVLVPLIILTFVVGCRYKTGPDIDAYERNYNAIINGASYKNIMGYSIEISFYLIVKLVSLLHLNFRALVIIYAFLSFYFIYKAINCLDLKKYETALFIIVFLDYEFLTYFIIMRQFLASSIIFYVFCKEEENKLDSIVNLILLVLAGFCHTGAFLILPIYYICKFKIHYGRFLAFMSILLAIWFGTTELGINFLMANKTYLGGYSAYTTYSNFGKRGELSYVIMFLTFIYILSFFLDRRIAIKRNQKIKDGFLYQNAREGGVLVTFLIYYAALPLSYIHRSYWYLALFLCLVPTMFCKKVESLFGRHILYLVFVSLCAAFLAHTLIAFVGLNGDYTMVPYKFDINIFK